MGILIGPFIELHICMVNISMLRVDAEHTTSNYQMKLTRYHYWRICLSRLNKEKLNNTWWLLIISHIVCN